jgi:hypothetical protein
LFKKPSLKKQVLVQYTGGTDNDNSIMRQSASQHSLIRTHERSHLSAVSKESQCWHRPDSYSILDAWYFVYINFEKDYVGVLSSKRFKGRQYFGRDRTSLL